MHVMVVGYGYLGRAVVRQGRALGWRFTTLRRQPEVSSDAGVVQLAADVGRADSLQNLPTDVDAVVYCVSPDERSNEAYEAAYPLGLRHCLTAMPPGTRTPPRRWLLVSSTAVYGQQNGAWVDEQSAVAPLDFTARCLLDAETLLHEAAQADAKLEATVLRLAGIYGPGRDRIVRQVASQQPVDLQSGRFANRMHVEDAAAAVLHLLQQPRAAACVIGADDEPADMGTVYRWIAAQLGVALQAATSTSARANKRCRNALLRRSGLVLRFPTFRQGYAQAIIDRRR